MPPPTQTRKVQIQNAQGFHLRPIQRFISIASEYPECDVVVVNADYPEDEANGKSLMSLVGLSAAIGTELEIKVLGDRATELLERLIEWVNQKFGEED